MATSEELRATGKEIQGQLWPATRTSAGGQFPAAKLAPDYFDYVQQTAFGMIWSRPGSPGPRPLDDHRRDAGRARPPRGAARAPRAAR